MAGSGRILVKGDGVDCQVQSTIAAVVEPMPDRVALRCRDRAGPRDLLTVGFEVGVPASDPLGKTNNFRRGDHLSEGLPTMAPEGDRGDLDEACL